MESPSGKLVHITTFGCQMNEYDSARMLGILSELGYAPAESPETADLVLLNTCSVREKAQHKVYSFVGALREVKRQRPGMIIGVGGCVAQQEGRQLLKDIPYLDLVFGTGALERLPELIAEAASGRRVACTDLDPGPLAPRRVALANPGLKAMVTVMQGCDNFCAYCVVPHVRGREKSRAAAQVVEEVAALAKAGVREVTLLGQNVNSYRDPEGGADFADLLEMVAGVPELWRVRFTTSHPKDLSPRLIEALAGIDKVMDQLHLPAQSGSDRILKAMRRGYTRARYLALVKDLRRRAPDLALGGDIIVGFPGETEADFQASLELIEAAGYDFLFSFKYSDRPFTKAIDLPGKIAEAEKSRRLARLQDRQREISLALHRAQVGKLEEVLVEGPAKRGTGLMTGRTRANRAVNFPGPPELAGRLVMVRVEQGLVNSLRGKLVDPA
ncbi:MAG: tRNA (N6-isopentenyl adenosine(37)-C2)-methylthiotransferase MiaB [Desulfarculus sp.]|nr:tRNA (N6-isopentenyl adenosine(37)-C2)-methylthiotransferase MiaB [Desulfarculus sp.]